jgi:uncharacterized protein
MVFTRFIIVTVSVLFIAGAECICQGKGKVSLKPVGYVNDFDDVFLPVQEQYLDSMMAAYERGTTTEIAVVTIDTSVVRLTQFDQYANRLLRDWGVGKKNKNNGILILICRGYRKIRIANGYGIEKIISDDQTKVIIDTAFVPSFKNGKYFEGVVKGLKAIMDKLGSAPFR